MGREGQGREHDEDRRSTARASQATQLKEEQASMSDDAQYIDFATVRDLLLEANERRRAPDLRAEGRLVPRRMGCEREPERDQDRP